MAKVEKLDEIALQAQLQMLPEWHIERGAVQRTFVLPTFSAAIFFVNAVAHLAELAKHHPDVEIGYNKVTLRWVTHSAGGITEKDVEMAHKVDTLWSVMQK
jgi:4a-hydroxytetrahydrobiopterin dehydratase